MPLSLFLQSIEMGFW